MLLFMFHSFSKRRTRSVGKLTGVVTLERAVPGRQTKKNQSKDEENSSLAHDLLAGFTVPEIGWCL
jgi:hypothetical protein